MLGGIDGQYRLAHLVPDWPRGDALHHQADAPRHGEARIAQQGAHQVVAENLGAVRAQCYRCLLMSLLDDAVRLGWVLGFLIAEGRPGDVKEVGGVRFDSHDIDYQALPAADHRQKCLIVRWPDTYVGMAA